MYQSFSVKEKILYGLDIKTMIGVEIGALANPMVSKEDGDVRYIDRATTAEIKEWYRKSEVVPLEKIVTVDYVWGNMSLSEATGVENYFDYCVAAHVIEHVPDLISWLKEIAAILKDGGIASFSVPDRRYTFDFLRPETMPADLLDAYFRKLRKPSVRHIYDHFSSFAELDIVEAWSSEFDGSMVKPAKDFVFAYQACLDAVHKNKYIDSHCWVFTEESFIELLTVLNKLDLLDFKIRRFFGVEKYTFEFVVQLEKIPGCLPPEKKHELFLESLELIKKEKNRKHKIIIQFEASCKGVAQIYYDSGNGFNEVESVSIPYDQVNEQIQLEFELPPISIRRIRFDPAMNPVVCKIFRVDVFLFGDDVYSVDLKLLRPISDIKSYKIKKDCFLAKTNKNSFDPAIEIVLP